MDESIIPMEDMESVEYQQDMADRRSQDPCRYEDEYNREYLDELDRDWKASRGSDDLVDDFFARLNGEGTYLLMSRTGGIFKVTKGNPQSREACGYNDYGMHHHFVADRKLVNRLIDQYDFSPGSRLILLSKEEMSELKKIGVRRFVEKGQLVEKQEEAFQALRFKPKSNHSTNIYMMLDGHTGFIKIGRSKNPSTRERTLQAQVPLLEMIWMCDGMNSDETHLHGIFKDKRLRGEWFDLSCRDVDYIKSLKWRK